MSSHSDNPRLILGLKLRNLRHERGATLRDIAQSAGVSVSYLSEVEKGKKYPKPEKLLRLAETLGVPFDELVSLQVREELGPLKAALSSPFLQEFPFHLFGFEPEDLYALVASDPAKAGALVQTFIEVGRTYDVQVEHFLLAALRSYQQMNRNYFQEIEAEATRYRRQEDLAPGLPLSAATLRRILETRHGYEIDTEALAADEDLSGFRSVFRAGSRPRLYLNGRLLPSQQAFVLAREIGYQQLDLEARAVSSSWLEVESFEQVLNNFKASYFAGALLLDRATVEADLGHVFRLPTWQPQALIEAMTRFDATPELYFTRLTELVPELFGLDEIYFMRFHNPVGSQAFQLTKVLNNSRVPVPHGIGLNEHYCRRWPSMRLLGRPFDRSEDAGRPALEAQRSRFLDEDAEFFVLSMVRPLVLADSSRSSVSLGFLMNDAFRRAVAFADDPAIPRRDVHLTCQRCPLTDCAERAAEPRIHRAQERQARKKAALEGLLRENG